MSLEWISDDEFVVEGVTYACSLIPKPPKSTAERFRLVKSREHVERYRDVISQAKPQTVVELGIFDGGSTALLAQLARPKKLIAVDLEREPCAALEEFVDRRNLRSQVTTFYGVDQADTARLEEILDAECGDAPLDLVIDDASHMLEPTRASFNVLFPRLRPGGSYVIEDWSGDLWLSGYGMVPAESGMNGAKPVSLLMFELVLACAYRPLVIEAVEITKGWALVRRGPKEVEPGSFDLSTSYGAFAQALMSSVDATSPRIGAATDTPNFRLTRQ